MERLLRRVDGCPVDGPSLPPEQARMLGLLAAGQCGVDRLLGADMATALHSLHELSHRGILEEVLVEGTERVATASRPRIVAPFLEPGAPPELPRMRRHTLLVPRSEEWSIMNPATPTVIRTTDRELVDLCRQIPARRGDRAASLLAFLRAHGFLAHEHGGEEAEWELHDALFHAVTVHGNATTSRYGATWRYRGVRPAPAPACLREDADAADREVALPRVGGGEIRDFGEVLTARRSVRSYAAAALPLDSVAGLLDLALRVRRVEDDGEDPLVFHAFPSGGARGELSSFLIVRACEGLHPGFYEYRPWTHRLRSIHAHAGAAEAALRILVASIGSPTVLPAAALVFAADYDRMAWKYESICYSTILRNVGCVYQTVSLAATALGIGSCALGGGWSPLLATTLAPAIGTRALVGALVLGTSAGLA